jgi:phage/plasmid-associated DNA primase
MGNDVDRLRRDVSLADTVAGFGYKLTRNGDELETCCPFHAEDSASFTIFPGRNDGIERFHCFGCGERGDVLDFVMKAKGVNLPDAIRVLDGRDQSRPNVTPRQIARRDPYAGIVITKTAATIDPGKEVRLYNPKRAGHASENGSPFVPSMIHAYRNVDGSLFGYVLRHDLPGGGKETPMVMPVTLPDGRRRWSRFPFPKPRPLYGLDALGDARQVIVVEGEKCRDALARKTTRPVVSWAGGTQGVKHTDWKPLAGRDVIMWPDADGPGLSTADEIGAIVTALECHYRVLDVSTLPDGSPPPKGWDCADAIADGWTGTDIFDFIKSSIRPWASPDLGENKPEPQEEQELAPALSVPAKVEPAPVPAPAAPVGPIGADGINKMPKTYSFVDFNSETFLARMFTETLAAVCESDIVHADGKLWAFGPTAWRVIDDQKLRRAVHAYDAAPAGEKATPIKLGSRMINGILNEVHATASDREFFEAPAVGMNVENGMVTIDDAGKIDVVPHDPQHRQRFTIKAGFHLHTDMRPTESSLLHKLLNGAFLDDPDAAAKIDLIGEMLGAAAFGLATRVKQPKAFVLIGETANNGKSTIASLFRALLPEDAVSAISPAYFNDEKRIIDLAGKAANVADELSAAAVAGEEFKAAVTGNPIQGRFLYANVTTFKPQALHCFTTNTLPRFSGGMDRGLQRRLVVLQFNRTIPDNEIIVDIVKRIRDEELDLLLGFAIAGAQRLKKRGNYTIPESSEKALDDWLRQEALNEWFSLRVSPAATVPYGGWLKVSQLYADFKSWAVEEGHKESTIISVNTFSQRIKMFPAVELKRSSAGQMVHGVIIKGKPEPVF